MSIRIPALAAIGLSMAALTFGANVAARVLKPGERLIPGEILYSDASRYLALLQQDGNFVVYRNTAPLRAIWSTNTVGMGASIAVMQHDGNFVLYDGVGRAIWNAASNGPGRSFAINEIGQAVVLGPGQIHWTSPGALLPLYGRLRAKPIFMSPFDRAPGRGAIMPYCLEGWRTCDAKVRALYRI